MRAELVTARACSILPVGLARLWLAHAPDVEQETRILEQVIAESIAAWEARTDGYLLGLQTWRIWLDDGEVTTQWLLPVGPLVSVTSITYYDPDDVSAVLAATNYQVITGDYGHIVQTYDAVMPSSLREREAWAVLVTVGATGAKVPYTATSGSPGLDDLAASGTYTGATRALWEVETVAAATPDTVRWRKIVHDVYGNRVVGAWTSATNVTGAAQLMGDGISITFAATTGHTAGDSWTVEAREVIPDDILLALRGLVQFHYRTKGAGVIETVSGQLIGLPYNVAEQVDRYHRHSINPFGLDGLAGVV